MAALLLCATLIILNGILAQDVDYGVPQGFPVAWYGDAYNQSNCETVKPIPTFLDGYFFCQTTASYGDQNDETGQKLIHMFDGISALALFDLNPVECTFSAAYYPTKSYKIWDLYNRDMKRSTVAWRTAFSPWNNTEKVIFDKQLRGMGYLELQPSVDFWKIGTNIVAGTEDYDLGLTFDVLTINDFRKYPFIENNTYFGNSGNSKVSYFPIHMPIHERTDLATGLIWNSVFSIKRHKLQLKNEFVELIFTVDPDGYRDIIAEFDGYSFEDSKCNRKTGVYSGDPTTLPRYMHSTTSTENYLILPLTSNVFNPCLFSLFHPIAGDKDVIWDPNPPNDTWRIYEFNDKANLHFLLYDKRDGTFRTIFHGYPQFVSHQINAYEVNETTIYADMITYDNNPYSGLNPEDLSHISIQDFSNLAAHLYRFTIDLVTNTSTNISLVPENPVALEYTQFNHKFEGLRYKWGYGLYGGYARNSSIWKIDVDEHSGENNLIFYESFDISLGEPYFVARPEAVSEDDGVLLVRGLDVSLNKSRVFIVDALSMKKIGEIIAPDIVPFGFHNRYYSKADLNLPPTPPLTPPTTCTTEIPPATTSSVATFPPASSSSTSPPPPPPPPVSTTPLTTTTNAALHSYRSVYVFFSILILLKFNFDTL